MSTDVTIRLPCPICGGWGAVSVWYQTPQIPPPPWGTYSTAVGIVMTMLRCMACWSAETERLRWIRRSHESADNKYSVKLDSERDSQ